MWLRERVQGLPSRCGGDGIILELAFFLENYVAKVNGNVVIPDVDALMYVVLSKAEKHAPYGKPVGTRACFFIFNVCHPEVFNTYTKYTILFSQTQQSLIYYLLD